MTQFMLLFSLGPVQPFIAQARKTRDLWLGSYLLSTLMEAAMKGMKERVFVFPATQQIEKNIPDLPNKYIAIFDDVDQATEAAKQSQRQIEECWHEICEDVWNRVIAEAQVPLDEARRIWEAQTDPSHLFEIFWVVVEGRADDYQAWLQHTQEVFDGRKRLREFRPKDEPGEKSTISGERETLRGKGTSRLDVQTFWYELTKHLQAKDIAKDGTERLDAIDTVKRFAHLARHLEEKGIQAGYPSTSSIATASYIEQLIVNSQIKALQKPLSKWFLVTSKDRLGETMPATIPYLKTRAITDVTRAILERDGDCYFPETFTPHHLEKDYGFDKRRATERDILSEQGKQAVQTLIRATSELSITSPTPYYALIQMDGDRMGTLLSGVSGEKEHKAISTALSEFAREKVPDIVEQQYPGRLVYAGGDDVFALAPLARDYDYKEGAMLLTVLNLVDRLQQEYCEVVKTAVIDQQRKHDVSASTGIAIAHHYTSLSYVRRVAKEAEEHAKELYGRNALVVTIVRRSGEQTWVGCHWHYDELPREEQPLALFTRFYHFFRKDVLSPKCIHTLLEEAATLVGLDSKAQASEIKRVLQRQRNDHKQDDLPDSEIPLIAQQLVTIARKMDGAYEIESKIRSAFAVSRPTRRYQTLWFG
jgi:CRISPR-associated protein Cmr2